MPDIRRPSVSTNALGRTQKRWSAKEILPLGFALLFAYAAKTNAQDAFVCPPDTKDSGYQPGNIVRWCEIQRDGRLLYNGPVWRWHRNGQLKSKEHYVFGDINGETPSWHENGTMSSRGTFKDGWKAGLWKYWDEKGHVKTEVTYQEAGNQRTDYYPTGQKKFTGVYVSTGKIGTWRYWHPDGNEKAQCDFGSGVFSIETQGCRIIADELEPKGYSRPIPFAELQSKNLILHVGKQAFSFKAPEGWVADGKVGSKEGVPLVFYPAGGSWRGKNSNLYLRVIFKDGAPFDVIQKQESEKFQENVDGYIETGAKKERLKSGHIVFARSITYKPLIHTDSPFAIVADNTVHESLNFVDASKEVVLLIILTSPSKMDLASSERALRELIQSLKFIAR